MDTHKQARGAQVAHIAGAMLCTAGLLLLVVQVGYQFAMPMPAIERVEAAKTEQPTGYGEIESWQPLVLPKRLCRSPLSPCYDNYRVMLEPQHDSLLLPGFAGSLAVTLNGHLLVTLGRLEPPIERLLFRPALVRLPERLRSGGADELIITVGSDRGGFNVLSPFYVGRFETLEPNFALAAWFAQDVLVASNGIYLVLGFLALLTYRLAPDNTSFLWFGLIVLHAAARNTFFLWTDPDWDFVRGLVYFQASMGMMVALAAFVAALVDRGSGRLFAYLYGMATLMVAGFGVHMAVDSYAGAYAANQITRLALLVTSAWILWCLVEFLLRGWHFVKPWVCALFAGAFVLTMHDVLAGYSHANVDLQLSNLSPLLVVVAFCLILAQQFSAALGQVRAHNVELSAAVARRETDLHRAYTHIRRAEQEQAVSDERLRILRDVHDGVGGRLAGLVLMARRQGQVDMAAHLEESLQDLRLIIDSIDEDANDDIAETLGGVMRRWDSLFEGQGVLLQWSIDCPEGLVVPPGWLVSMMRGLQECLNNILRHAQAQTASLQLDIVDKTLRVRVTDDGIGFDPARPAGVGRGLHNLRARIAQLGGYVAVRSETPGTQVTLRVPLPPVDLEDEILAATREITL